MSNVIRIKRYYEQVLIIQSQASLINDWSQYDEDDNKGKKYITNNDSDYCEGEFIPNFHD